MAEDARISTALPNHPKTKKLRRRLGDGGCWSLVCLFLWAAGNRWDGSLEDLTDEDIELAADWQGAAGAMVAALVDVGFLDGEPGRYVIHDWQDHNPWAASRGQRVEAARAAAAARWERRTNAIGKRPASDPHADGNNKDADGMRPACEPHANRIENGAEGNAHHPTPPNPTQPNREEQKQGKPARAALALPEWIPIEQWQAFIEMRKRMKAGLTDRAVMLAIGELEKLRAQGFAPAAVLDQSVANGWKGLFPIKSRGRASPVPGGYLAETRSGVLQALNDQAKDMA